MRRRNFLGAALSLAVRPPGIASVAAAVVPAAIPATVEAAGAVAVVAPVIIPQESYIFSFINYALGDDNGVRLWRDDIGGADAINAVAASAKDIDGFCDVQNGQRLTLNLDQSADFITVLKSLDGLNEAQRQAFVKELVRMTDNFFSTRFVGLMYCMQMIPGLMPIYINDPDIEKRVCADILDDDDIEAFSYLRTEVAKLSEQDHAQYFAGQLMEEIDTFLKVCSLIDLENMRAGETPLFQRKKVIDHFLTGVMWTEGRDILPVTNDLSERDRLLLMLELMYIDQNGNRPGIVVDIPEVARPFFSMAKWFLEVESDDTALVDPGARARMMESLRGRIDTLCDQRAEAARQVAHAEMDSWLGIDDAPGADPVSADDVPGIGSLITQPFTDAIRDLKDTVARAAFVQASPVVEGNTTGTGTPKHPHAQLPAPATSEFQVVIPGHLEKIPVGPALDGMGHG